MLTWRKFADEVPTEERHVLTNDVMGDDPCLWFYSDESVAWEARDGRAIDADTGDAKFQWRETVEEYCHTHWSYIEPPEGT